MAATRRGKLAYKILFCFLAVSLAPMGYVAYRLVNISQAALRKETLSMQESLAVGFADTVNKYVMTFKNVLTETASLEEFSSMNPAKQQQYLNRIISVHLAVLELSVVNSSGVEILRNGRFLGPKPQMRQVSSEEYFSRAMSRGQFIGRLERFQRLYPALTIAVAIMDQKTAPPRPVGVLTARISLNGLSSMLGMEFPPAGKSVASVVASDGFMIAHSNLEAYQPDARLSDDILKILTTQGEEKGGGDITLPNGIKLLGAYADVKGLDWIVYVQQPLETAYQAADEMKSQTLSVFIWVFVVVILLSLLVAVYITQPIRILREAADRLGKGQFEDLPEIMMTDDEIGDLAQTFLTMSESLKEKTGELINAKQELEKFTKFLEKRVEARTRELKAAQDELIKKERLAAIGQMASVVGHEIRNPLAVINNSIYFIKTKLGASLETDVKVAKHIKIIESEIQQANGIINEILTYSRSRELKPERVSLDTFIEEVLSIYPFPPHVKVEKKLEAGNPAVDIDVTEIKQALRNIVGNAIEVMPPAPATGNGQPKEAPVPVFGGVIRIKTTMTPEGTALIEVSDTGPGIPPDVLEKIFTPFFTTKARGTGLGLAVVRKVVERHKGRVDVESIVGKGTTFRLYLPVVQKVKA